MCAGASVGSSVAVNGVLVGDGDVAVAAGAGICSETATSVGSSTTFPHAIRMAPTPARIASLVDVYMDVGPSLLACQGPWLRTIYPAISTKCTVSIK